MAQSKIKARSRTKGNGGKPYWEMTAAELKKATREFDQEFVFDKSKPLNAQQRRQVVRARRRGRPKTGQGAKAISLSVEQGLLRRADAWAKDRGMSRAQLVARGLELAMAAGTKNGR